MNEHRGRRAAVVVGVWASMMAVGPSPAPAAAQDAPALKTYHITAKDIPEPTTSTPNPPKPVPKPADAKLVAPSGFRVEPFAQGFKRPRWVVEAPNGDVFVSDEAASTVYVLRDANRNHTIEDSERSEFATGLKRPFGMAFSKDSFYVANTDAVLRYPYRKGQLKAEGEPKKIADMPSASTGHWTRTLRFSPDGKLLYVTVGSGSNVDVEPEPRGSIFAIKPDGSGREVIATGVRNAIGLDFHPKTKEPWISVQERDGLGDDVVPDYVAHLKKGAFYGWPYAYAGQREEPRRKGERPDLVKTAVTPDVFIQAHSAIMGLVFYNKGAFPAKYRGGAFAALRGSSSRTKRTGYKVIFLPFANGQPTASYEDFVVGWMLGEDKPDVWGRPVGLAVLKDGSMLVTDDAGGTIYRVSYGK